MTERSVKSTSLNEFGDRIVEAENHLYWRVCARDMAQDAAAIVRAMDSEELKDFAASIALVAAAAHAAMTQRGILPPGTPSGGKVKP